MATYRVNDDGVAHARALIEQGAVDTTSDWSESVPSTAEENRQVQEHGYDGFGQWFLALDEDASEATKGRYAFPYGDFTKLHRDGLVHAKQRAAQYEHAEIAGAADDLLSRLDP